MRSGERLLKKAFPVSILPDTLIEIQKSPIKIVQSYLEEHKIKTNSLDQNLLPINILDKQYCRKSSSKYLVGGRQTPNKVMQDSPIQLKKYNRKRVSHDLKVSSSNSFLALPPIYSDPVECLNRYSSTKKNNSRNNSNDNENSKLNLYNRKLTRMRSQYQQELIKRCQKFTKFTSEYRDYTKF